MKPDNETPGLARIAIGALAILGHAGGWMILLTGGFSHSTRFSRDITHIDGAPAWVMAAIFFAMGTLGVAALMQAAGVRRRWCWLACGAAVLAPFAFVTFR